MNTAEREKRIAHYAIYAEVRDSCGVSDYYVAKTASLPKSTFTEWKQGRSEPKVEKLQKIATCLNVPIGTLLGE